MALQPIGTKLTNIREGIPLRLEKVAADAEISATTLRKLENCGVKTEPGKRINFEFTTLMAVLDILNVLPSEFLEGYDHESQMVA